MTALIALIHNEHFSNFSNSYRTIEIIEKLSGSSLQIVIQWPASSIGSIQSCQTKRSARLVWPVGSKSPKVSKFS